MSLGRTINLERYEKIGVALALRAKMSRMCLDINSYIFMASLCAFAAVFTSLTVDLRRYITR